MPPKKGAKIVVRLPQASKPKVKKPQSAVQRIRGRGDYSIGSQLGGKIGSWIGDSAQKMIETITGMGDYQVKMNSIVNPSGPPVFQQNGRHDIIVCHREFVALVQSPGASFAVQSYAVNPTSNCFVWLPALASNFELYKFLGVVFEFKATSATAVSSTNTALGSVIMATRYNALSAQFTSQAQMEAYEFSTSTVAFTSAIHPVECAPSENALSELYCDPGFAGGDPRFSILGIFDIATVGQQAQSTVGELWVSYHVQLIRPRLLGLISTQGFTARYGAIQATTLSESDIFASLRAAQQSNTSLLVNNAAISFGLQGPTFTGLPNSQSLELVFGGPGAPASLATNTIIFPTGVSGAFQIRIIMFSATAAVLAAPTVTGTNGLFINNDTQYGVNGSSNPYTVPTNGATTVSVVYTIGCFIVPNPSGGSQPTITFASTGVLPSVAPVQIAFECFQLNS